MNLYVLQKYIPFTVLILSVLTLNPYSIIPIGNTTTTWLFQVIILFMFFYIIPHVKNRNKKKIMLFVLVYVIYNVINFIRGLFVSETYWDYKALFNNGFAMLLPVVAYASTNLNFVRILFKTYLKYTLPLILFFYSFVSTGAVGFFLVPISVLALFLPMLKKPWNIMVLFISFFVITLSLGARSNVIKFSVPILFSSIYFVRKYLTKNILEVIRNLVFLLPFVLFYNAAFGSFNIFNLEEYVGEVEYTNTKKRLDGGESKAENLAADTRTPLYVEVIKTAEKYNSWVFGRSPARGNETELFDSIASITGRNERPGNEVAILNIFTWTGLVGVALYFLVFYHTSYLAINKSNNIISKILGLYLSFRWCYAWVEDINYFTLTTYILWVTIGLTLSPEFRMMNNAEIKLWVNSLFTKKMEFKYEAYKKLKKKETLVNSKN